MELSEHRITIVDSIILGLILHIPYIYEYGKLMFRDGKQIGKKIVNLFMKIPMIMIVGVGTFVIPTMGY